MQAHTRRAGGMVVVHDDELDPRTLGVIHDSMSGGKLGARLARAHVAVALLGRRPTHRAPANRGAPEGAQLVGHEVRVGAVLARAVGHDALASRPVRGEYVAAWGSLGAATASRPALARVMRCSVARYSRPILWPAR